MATKITTVQASAYLNHKLNEVAIYGGLPLRRSDILRHAREIVGIGGEYDAWWYTRNAPPAPAGMEPMAYEKFLALEAKEMLEHQQVDFEVLEVESNSNDNSQEE
jgi:hypothetical protein